MKGVYIGTSGWFYKGWHAKFYPEELRKSELLSFYASRFSTVEINASFYRLLTEKAVVNWVANVPDDFIFAVKGSRFITHMKKLIGIEEALLRFFEPVNRFEDKLGPILWQLPGMLHKDVSRLDEFLAQLPKSRHHAIEFRHPSWFEEETFEVLRSHRAALVWISSLAMPQVFTVTGDFVYVRFHGLEGGASHDYRERELEIWAEQIRKQAALGRQVFAYFNNDLNARAPENAVALRRMIEGRRASTHEKSKRLCRPRQKREMAVH